MIKFTADSTFYDLHVKVPVARYFEKEMGKSVHYRRLKASQRKHVVEPTFNDIDSRQSRLAKCETVAKFSRAKVYRKRPAKPHPLRAVNNS